jgi:hypothetical protein
MVFAKRLREGVIRGDITCSVRIWTRPHVTEGRRYRMGDGEIEIESDRAKQNAPDSFESWDVCRSALPQVLLNQKTNLKPQVGKWPVRAITHPKVTGRPLLHRNQIKFPRRFFIEQSALLRIAATPVSVTSRNAQEIARCHPLLASVVLIQIRPL